MKIFYPRTAPMERKNAVWTIPLEIVFQEYGCRSMLEIELRIHFFFKNAVFIPAVPMDT